MIELNEQQEQEMIEKAKAGDPEANYQMSLWALEQAMAEPGEERWNRLAAKCLVKSAEAGYGPAREKMNELLVQTGEPAAAEPRKEEQAPAAPVGAHEAPAPGAHEVPNSVPIEEEEEHVPAHAVGEKEEEAPIAPAKPQVDLGAVFAGVGAKAKGLFGKAKAGISKAAAPKAPAAAETPSGVSGQADGAAAPAGGKAPLLNFSQWDDAKWKKVQTICIIVCVVLAILIAVLLITGRSKKSDTGREEIVIPEAEVVITPEPGAPDASAAAAGNAGDAGDAGAAAGADTAAAAEESPAPAEEYPTQAILDEIAGANLDVFPETGDYVTEAKTVTVSTSGSSLNVRRGPGGSYDAVSAMENGTTTDVYAYKNGWALVKYDGVWGWCSNEYLK